MVGFLYLYDSHNLFVFLNTLNASRMCLGCNGPTSWSFDFSCTSKAASTISPTNTFAMPDMAMTTLAETALPHTVWIIYKQEEFHFRIDFTLPPIEVGLLFWLLTFEKQSVCIFRSDLIVLRKSWPLELFTKDN